MGVYRDHGKGATDLEAMQKDRGESRIDAWRRRRKRWGGCPRCNEREGLADETES